MNDELKISIAQLEKTIVEMQRITALMKMSLQHNSYRPLIRVMCKLNIVRDWPIF